VSSTEQSVSGAEFQVLNYGAIRSTERSVGSTSAMRSEAEQSVTGAERKGWAPSQIGDQHRVDDVERGAICAKRRKPSVERGVIRDRCNRKVRGPATRDVF